MKILFYLLLITTVLLSCSNVSKKVDYYNRGLAKHKLEDYGEAILDYNKAIELDPNYTDAYNVRGRAKNDLKDYRGAILDLNKAIKLNPNSNDITKGTAHYNRGNAKLNLQDYRGAILDYSKAIELNPFILANAYCNRGHAKRGLADAQGAFADFNTAIFMEENFADAYLGRGIVKLYFEQKESGCLDLSKAGELGSVKAYDVIKEYCN